jgi:hypothetical protein
VGIVAAGTAALSTFFRIGNFDPTGLLSGRRGGNAMITPQLHLSSTSNNPHELLLCVNANYNIGFTFLSPDSLYTKSLYHLVLTLRRGVLSP